MEKKYLYILKQIDKNIPFENIKIHKKDKEDVQTLFTLLEKHHIITTDVNKINEVYLNPKFEKELAVWVHVTNQCNFRCTYCFVSKTPQTIPADIAKKSLHTLMISAKADNMKSVNIKFAGGEPLLEVQKVVDIVNYVKKIAVEIGIRAKFSVTTNASLLTEKNCQILLDNGIHAHISIDGIGKYQDINRPFTNKMGTYTYVKKGVDMAYKAGVLSNFLITITSTNVKHLPVFCRFLMKNYPKIPIQLNFYKNHTKQDGELTPKHSDLISSLKKTYLNLYKFYSDDIQTDLSRLLLLDGIQFYLPSLFHCGAGKNYVTLDYDGTFKICPVVHRKITVQKNEDALTKLKNNIFLGDNPITQSECAKCQWVVMCKGGCRAHKYYIGMNTLRPSPYCLVYKTLVPILAKLEGKHKLKRLLS